jgi:hypothetical protein
MESRVEEPLVARDQVQHRGARKWLAADRRQDAPPLFGQLGAIRTAHWGAVSQSQAEPLNIVIPPASIKR